MELLLAITIFYLSSFHLSSSAFTPTNPHFLACGSTSIIPLITDNPARNFTPDSDFFTPKSNSISLSNPNSSLLYATARAFTERSTYRFKLDSQGTHVLRLHFFSFTDQNHDLATARFDVSALDRLLLFGFSVPNTQTPVIKEYLLWVDTAELALTFIPHSNSSASSLAFVNAIEVFPAPTNLISNSTDPESVPSSRRINQLAHQALEIVHRINVGGQKVTPANDTLWRTWVPDDEYLFTDKDFSLDNSTSPKNIKYAAGVDPVIAPANVYDTARTMNISSSMVLSNPNFDFNITWSFPVTSNYSYLIRMHFCDFVSKIYTDLYFDVYIGDQFAHQDLHPADKVDQPAEPFFLDSTLYVPTSQHLINVSIGRSSKSSPTTANAILNGLEIMKVNPGSLDGSINPDSGISQTKKIHVAILISTIVGGVFVIASAIAVLVLVCKRCCSKSVTKPAETPFLRAPYRTDGANSVELSSQFTERTAPSASPHFKMSLHISFIEIKVGTNDFDDKLVIGTGGFGKVYRGVLSDGTRVAVKRGTRRSGQGYPEFQREILLLSQIRHRHLVSLIGYCEEQSEMILVYEYMEKGPLRDCLHGSDLPCLSWKQRLQICIDAARGLNYLHTGYSHNIIHRDIKSTNILLGDKYLAKVSDFGLSRWGPSYGETHVSTGVKGTFGYLDPEYFKILKLTDKSDVYSFGMVLLEVLCARPVIDQTLSSEQINLAEWALQWKQRGQLEKIIDPRLVGKINVNSLSKFGETAEKCLAECAVDRPTMADVLWNLEYALQLQETELKREPYEDSGNVESQFPVTAVGWAPSTRISIDEGRSMAGMREVCSDTTASKVFSQIIVDEGR
ncbi:probable receptor-like protein kinase At5g24010 [Phoenix dactylifera]|uniref:Probable receptor-like protein kinase At5g24010 n=1 Tax=Phoenix dactylifera TaxID=42345 RepID=A0A8B9AA65_PHODC|nr:probable receptor-like protein kinase At5g24010 [Phoenix dactylifera]XP_038982612.1 probable receptor-like protein kinase At5g24010 [Phoenix dactylifera]